MTHAPGSDLKALAIRLGRILGRVWLFLVHRRVRPDDVRRASEALNRLRRRYVFGGVSREAYEAQMSALAHRKPWQRGARPKTKVP